MEKILIAIFVFSACFTSCLSIVCYNMTDGVYERNCRAYTRCIDGEEEIINCEVGDAYNTQTQKCESKWDVPPPCGTYRDCADKKDGFYPDLETKCTSYYTCSNGIFFGHSLCPGDLVYNINQQVCDYTYSAPPPCGTNKTDADVGNLYN